MKITVLSALLFIITCQYSFAGVGESAVITLVFPFGARSCGMGEVGTALADDGSALFYNPAGLAIQNRKWEKAAVSQFFEPLLPLLGLRELWHLTLSAHYQPPDPVWGGFGLFFNYINMGENEMTDGLGRHVRLVHSWEAVFALGWGFNFRELGDTTHNFGLTVKPFISALALGAGPNGEGVAASFAFDAGYLWLFGSGFRFGLTLMNMGPNVFYIDRTNLDPIPFTANLALAYKKGISIDGNRIFDFACELRLDKELVVNHLEGDPDPFWRALFTEWTDDNIGYELSETNVHLGGEVGYRGTIFLRQGFLFDYIGERYELTIGTGVSLFNHLNWDGSLIIAPEGFMKGFLQRIDPEKTGATGIRNLQWRISFTYSGFGAWSERDAKWWRD